MAVSDTSCSVHPEGGKGDDVLETVARIGSKLASEEGGETVVVESLRELQGVHIHRFFYRPKYPDISDISCLSIGADKK
jgi:hypothetical protein